MCDAPPAPSTNSTLDTIVFSSTMIPQSVQTEEPDGPRDSIARDPQFGHDPAVEAAGFLSPSLVLLPREAAA
eukprot:CAMPEP_0201690960 /NCGR_PEP_ID=MMETSP0578-20130828/4250_1 /ASSEMBLY_ACC=CAM_ASM_000663 /TAXON_ID=267565 /ORGANISM="Skeletonema grethea, Strain CCMP 1804" /LENGTH=71 /DNA_ID=CAMNT_0048176063 /DNA_START=310 /DNA_END=522 /DNA_ORIENTATION=-